MADDIEFSEGLYFNDPHKNAPDFVIGKLAIKPAQFIKWLDAQRENDKGYVNLQIKRSKAGKVYIALDTWEPERKEETTVMIPAIGETNAMRDPAGGSRGATQIGLEKVSGDGMSDKEVYDGVTRYMRKEDENKSLADLPREAWLFTESYLRGQCSFRQPANIPAELYIRADLDKRKALTQQAESFSAATTRRELMLWAAKVLAYLDTP